MTYLERVPDGGACVVWVAGAAAGRWRSCRTARSVEGVGVGAWEGKTRGAKVREKMK
jgi:hypothetical protein